MRSGSSLIILISVLLGSMGLARMQPPVICTPLPAEECAVLAEVAAQQQALGSGTLNLQLQITLTAIPGLPESPSTITVVGSGAFNGSPAALRNALNSDPANPQPISPDFDADLVLAITLPDSLRQQINPALNNPLIVPVRLVDGVGYINLDPFSSLGLPAGWASLDLQQLTTVQNDALPGLRISNLLFLLSPAFTDQFALVARLPDATQGTQVYHQYQTTHDFRTLAQNPQLRDTLRQRLQLNDDPSIQPMADLVGSAFQGLTLSTTRQIHPETRAIHHEETVIEWDFGWLQRLGLLTGDGVPQVRIQAIVETTNFNSAVLVGPPPSALPLDLQALGLGL
jgi:hypothetical protein